MSQQLKISLFVVIILTLTSCVSNKKYVYLQDKGNVKADSSGLMPVQPYEYKLQKGDILYISLTTEDEKMNKIFVPSVGAGGQMLQQAQGVSGTMLYYIGFTVDSKGAIDLPYLGTIMLADKTLEEAKNEIDKSLKIYFKHYFLNVKLADFKFSVLGFVNRPGQYFFNQNKVTLVEAIAQAGELQSLAKRYSLQLYRQYPDGVRVHNIDLTSKDLISSPFWYIQPNDILYVVPLEVRKYGDLTSLQSSFTVIAPIISTLLLVLNTYILVKNL